MVRESTPDDRFMAEAVRLAAHIPWRPWPNPPVGAVIVNDGRIVGHGAHHGAGLPHAETIALARAGALAQGATLYSTLEPCNHHGRTPPCTEAVIKAGIRRVVAGVADPNPRLPGGGLEVIRDAGLDVSIGVLGEAVLDLIWPFVATQAFERPFVLLKTALSSDGRFAPPKGTDAADDAARYLTGIEARRDVHRLRRWADVILIGEGTLAADRPLLNGRLATSDDACPSVDPMPAYVDSDLSYRGDWPWTRFFVFAASSVARDGPSRRIEEAGGQVVLCEAANGRVSPDGVLTSIFSGIGHSVMLEAGPTLSSAFLAGGLVDRWVRYTAPVVLSSGPTWPDREGLATGTKHHPYSLTRTERCGRDVKEVFDRMNFAETLRRLTGDRASRLRAKGAA